MSDRFPPSAYPQGMVAGSLAGSIGGGTYAAAEVKRECRMSMTVSAVRAVNDRLSSIFAQLDSFNNSRLGPVNQVGGPGESTKRPPAIGYINELSEQLDTTNVVINAIEAQLQRLNEL